MRNLTCLFLFLAFAAPAWAVCPSTPTDCVSTPIYKTAQGWSGLLGGPWTTATRPTGPVLGLTGFNSTLGVYETWNGSLWTQEPTTSQQLNITAPWTFNVGPFLLPGGTPATPTNGQMWLTGMGFFMEIGGVAVGPFLGDGGPTLPGSAGGGGLYVCVDTSGIFYKKASCP